MDMIRAKEMYRLASGELAKAERRKSDLTMELRELEGRITACRNIRDELKKTQNICTDCDGHGQVREFIAQDESRLVECRICKGRGVRA